jgi:hypothetical protein
LTLALLITLLIVNAGWLLLFDRKDKRHQQQVGRLLQRIQAPEIAVAEHVTQEDAGEPVAAMQWDNDDDYWKAN